MGSDTNAPHRSTQSPREILVELCKQLYDQGGMPGTAGGMSIVDGATVYMSPSGVQKERMIPEDLMGWDTLSETWVFKPDLYKPSASTSLFLLLHKVRQAGAVIHTHSQNAVLASMLGRAGQKEFRISHVENIKAIPRVVSPGNLGFADTLVIPIIENTAHEDELEPELREVLEKYPQAPAVLVRRHGLYVWGSNVWKAKIINETIEYLLELAIKMNQLGLDLEIGSK